MSKPNSPFFPFPPQSKVKVSLITFNVPLIGTEAYRFCFVLSIFLFLCFVIFYFIFFVVVLFSLLFLRPCFNYTISSIYIVVFFQLHVPTLVLYL
jgi:hypothetical protein